MRKRHISSILITTVYSIFSWPLPSSSELSTLHKLLSATPSDHSSKPKTAFGFGDFNARLLSAQQRGRAVVSHQISIPIAPYREIIARTALRVATWLVWLGLQCVSNTRHDYSHNSRCKTPDRQCNWQCNESTALGHRRHLSPVGSRCHLRSARHL